jgi:hypothetical protein
MRCLGVAVVLALASAPAFAEKPRTVFVPPKLPADRLQGLVVNTKTIFLNRCVGGCQVMNGFTDSRTNRSAIGSGTLSQFPHGNTSWNTVVNCMKDVFDRFNVVITDVDPGRNVDHFEIMIAGTPGNIGLPNYIGGIAEYACIGVAQCERYLPNALVFAFAGNYANDPEEICATAAQEITHTWSLDHVTDPSDPLTYNDYSGRRQFKDNVRCGSDCVNGVSPFNLTCNGQEHTCMSTGTAVQNNVQIITALVGPAGAAAPNLTVTSPATGAAVGAGFTVDVECTAPAGVQEVQFSIDGNLMTTDMTAPYSYATPPNLNMGPHRITVLCGTTQQAIATKQIDVILGAPCSDDSQCQAGFICHNACIAGPETAGGLGAPCNGDGDCVAGQCASDGSQMLCTIPCDLSAVNCPSGFTCLEAGAESGVCWAGGDDGGCCDTGRGSRRSPLQPLLCGAALALWITRRRSKKRR